MKPDVISILNGFLKLPNLQKLELVNAVNEYFDEIGERESFRANVEQKFSELKDDSASFSCICCGRE